jgi:hypothetical protein
MGRCRNSECGENGICACECLHEGGAIAKRLDHSNARSARHVGYAFRSRTDDGSKTDSCCSAHAEYSLTETTCSADDGHMMRYWSRLAIGSRLRHGRECSGERRQWSNTRARCKRWLADNSLDQESRGNVTAFREILLCCSSRQMQFSHATACGGSPNMLEQRFAWAVPAPIRRNRQRTNERTWGRTLQRYNALKLTVLNAKKRGL